MVQDEYRTCGQSQILPNKATDNIDEFAQCEDLYKLLLVKNLLFAKDQEGEDWKFTKYL